MKLDAETVAVILIGAALGAVLMSVLGPILITPINTAISGVGK